MKPFDYINWFQALGPGGSVATAVTPEDLGSVDLSWNLGPAQEIGYFEHRLPEGTYTRVLKVMDQVGFDQMSSGPPRPPDTAIISFGKNYWDGQNGVNRGWAVDDFPQAMQPVLDELKALTDVLRKHPVRAIRGEAAVQPSSLSLQDPLTIAVTIHSIGRELVKIDNPFHKHMEEGLTVQLMVRKDKPWEQLKEGEQHWLNCTLAQIRPIDRKAKLPSDRQVPLAPGATLQFTVYKTVMLSPGQYRGQLTYRTSQKPGDTASIRGVVLLDLAPFEVKAQ